MAKNLKINVKNAQLAEALNIGKLKKPATKKKVAEPSEAQITPPAGTDTAELAATKATKKRSAADKTGEKTLESKPKVSRKKSTEKEEAPAASSEVIAKEVTPPSLPAREERPAPASVASPDHVEKTPPAAPVTKSEERPSFPQRNDSPSPYRSSPTNHYTPRSPSSGYQPRPQSGGYPQRPQGDGYSQRPPYQSRPQGEGYSSRPQSGGYPPRPQGEGYSQRPPYQSRPQGEGYAPRPQSGGYPPRPQGGGYSPRPPYGASSPSQQRYPSSGNAPYRPATGGGYPPRSGPSSQTPYNRPYPQQQPYRPGGPSPYPRRPGPPGAEGAAGRPPYRPRPPFPGGAPGGFRPGGFGRPPIGGPRDSLPPEDGKGERRTPRAFDTKPAQKEFREHKPSKKMTEERSFDARDRQGLRNGDEEGWRKRRPSHKIRYVEQEEVIRPKSLQVRIPITIKDLASEMKLKSSQLISKLFMKGVVATINDFLDDETTIQLLGHDFDCEIGIDRTEEVRLKITDKTIKQEIAETDPIDLLILRPPVIAFMGHVDHGKTSLIDAIRTSDIAAGEAGAITQHIGAFKCHTSAGDIAILDTPGHEAFSAMRSRGSDITDIVVLVVAGDEGMRTQTIEAMQQAKAAAVPIVVAINKCDKPNFNAETVYRQLADHELLPEAWGGQTITINCSATTKEGIPTLLEMLALQAEVLELKANPHCRARGTVIESEMHKGLGTVATVLVQNGTLKLGDALVFSHEFAKVKTMHDEHDRELTEAGPSTPVKITGLSGLPPAGSEFIVVKSEKEAMEIAEKRSEGHRHMLLHQAKKGLDSMLADKAAVKKKVLTLIIRADVQGSVEAIKTSLLKIASDKAELNIISAAVGEISESDVQLASASKAVILGFHTQVESHAESLIKALSVSVRLHDIIYHAVDDVKALMLALLDKVAHETSIGSAEVKAIFKSSQSGIIAGCMILDGIIKRSSQVRQIRDKKEIWKGSIHSLKKVKEDVREMSKGHECGIVLSGQGDVKVGDILEAFEVSYLQQEL